MGVRSAILRIGQVAGPVTHGTSGMWSKHEWLPSLIASSKYLGMLPDDLGLAINWVLVDLCDLGHYIRTQAARQEREGGVAYFHVVDPQEAHWSDVVPTIQEYFDGRLELVSLAKWVEALAITENEDAGVHKNPALKLLGWFRSLVSSDDAEARQIILDTKETEKPSQAMRQLCSVNGNWMTLWLRQWGF